MRPDQHKQKRSTQYKKKHGINDKSKNEDNNTNNKKEKGASSGEASTQWQLPQQQKVNNTKEDKSKPDEDTNASSAEEENVQVSSFRRRKIESNWDRYRSLPPENEDENPSEIGTDFGKLLSQTADALSQFRFKDEKEWEDDKTLLSSNFLALDCEALANSLQCLPLHERLGLNTALFTDEQLEEFSAEAERSRSLYNPGSSSTIVQEQQTALDISAMHSVLSAAMHLVPAILKMVKSEPTHPENGAETEPVKEEEVVVVVEEEAVVPGSEDSPMTHSVKEPKSKSAKKKKSALAVPKVARDPVSQEDELDMLLSLGNAKPQPGVEESVKANQSVEISASVEKKYVSSATASLEDWLDSVLDS